MEEFTPQYKRGKYIRRKVRKKRIKIVIICLCVAIVLAAAALLIIFREQIFGKEAPTSVPTDASVIMQSSEAPTEEPSEAPLLGREVELADGKLLLTYDSDALTLRKDSELTTLLVASGEADTPRMDLQKLPSKLGMLRDSEKERIAIGLMQAYYYHPQHTAEVSPTILLNTKQEFSVTMQIPAIDDAPAAACSVRLLAVGDELWAAVLLQPEGVENPALANAFAWLTATEESG